MFRVSNVLSAYWEMVKRGAVMSEFPESFDELYPSASCADKAGLAAEEESEMRSESTE